MLETNVLYYGDNLDILRRYVPDESVDLIYLDPPFNSGAGANAGEKFWGCSTYPKCQGTRSATA